MQFLMVLVDVLCKTKHDTFWELLLGQNHKIIAFSVIKIDISVVIAGRGQYCSKLHVPCGTATNLAILNLAASDLK